METIMQYLNDEIKIEIQKFIQKNLEDIEEIRLRSQRPIVIKTASKNVILEHVVTIEELLKIFQRVCEHSIYSYQKQICEGFITIKGGHRVGISGSCAIENGKVININYISSLNFRVARQKKECANKILNFILNSDNVSNTIIASKPGCGKTTIVRDLVRILSTGSIKYKLNPKTCGIVDERGEIASMYKGIPQNDIGIFSDVIDNISKSDGMKLLVRSMSPEIIVCDEIGSKQDIEAINYAICSGVKGIFTMHGNSLEELLLNNQVKELLEKNIVETIIFLDDKIRGNIREIYKLNKESKTYLKINISSKLDFSEYNIM